MVVYEVADANIPDELRKLTGEKGTIVLVSVSKDHADAATVRRRYELRDGQAAFADEHGNLLKRAKPGEIGEAVPVLDELTAELVAQWSTAIREGAALIEKKQFAEAARVLQGFAFAAGTPKAAEGKALYDRVAGEAKKDFQVLITGLPAGKMPPETRQEWIGKLTEFAKKWPRTSAAFAAEDRAAELQGQTK